MTPMVTSIGDGKQKWNRKKLMATVLGICKSENSKIRRWRWYRCSCIWKVIEPYMESYFGGSHVCVSRKSGEKEKENRISYSAME